MLFIILCAVLVFGVQWALVSQLSPRIGVTKTVLLIAIITIVLGPILGAMFSDIRSILIPGFTLAAFGGSAFLYIWYK